MRHQLKILTVLMTLMVSLSAFSTEVDFDLEKIDQALEQVRSLKKLPPFQEEPDQINAIDHQFSPEVRGWFYEIQRFIFNRSDLIALKACEDCEAIANAGDMAVYLQPDFLADLERAFKKEKASEMIRFVLAHEISHFTHEYATLLRPQGLSPHGGIPLLTKRFADYYPMDQFVKLTTAQQEIELQKYLKRAKRSHIEVDLLGFMTLKKMGVKITRAPLEMLRHTQDQTPQEDLPYSDIPGRLQVLEEVLNEI